jgi:hypothetical protein
VTALRHLHSLGILHRDLRSANVLVSSLSPLCVLLADFGVSRLLSAFASGAAAKRGIAASAVSTVLTGGAALGPLQWSAPEVRDGSSDAGVVATTASDVYMLGCLLYELLSGGQPPFHWLMRNAELMEARLRSSGPVHVPGIPVPLPGLLHANVLQAAAQDGIALSWALERAAAVSAPAVEALVALMKECMEVDPNARPELPEVANRVVALLEEHVGGGRAVSLTLGSEQHGESSSSVHSGAVLSSEPSTVDSSALLAALRELGIEEELIEKAAGVVIDDHEDALDTALLRDVLLAAGISAVHTLGAVQAITKVPALPRRCCGASRYATRGMYEPFAAVLCCPQQATYSAGQVAPAAVLPVLRAAGVAADVVEAVAALLLAPGFLAGGVTLANLGSRVLRDKGLPGGPLKASLVDAVKRELAAVRG